MTVPVRRRVRQLLSQRRRLSDPFAGRDLVPIFEVILTELDAIAKHARSEILWRQLRLNSLQESFREMNRCRRTGIITPTSPIEVLDLPTRIEGALKRCGVDTVGLLVGTRENRLTLMPEIGRVSVKQIHAALAAKSLRLGQWGFVDALA